MDWKDTVMNEEQIKKALKEKGYNGDGLIIVYLAHQALEAQAEISFKAGQEAERERIFKRIDYMNVIGYFDHESYREVAKLKEWGIKEG